MNLGVVGVAAGFTAVTCAGLSAASWRALVRTGNSTILWLVVGFGLLGAKNAVKAWRAFVGLPDSHAFEIAFSLVDLAAVALIAWPIVAGRLRT